jgi:hypothetical protein
VHIEFAQNVPSNYFFWHFCAEHFLPAPSSSQLTFRGSICPGIAFPLRIFPDETFRLTITNRLRFSGRTSHEFIKWILNDFCIRIEKLFSKWLVSSIGLWRPYINITITILDIEVEVEVNLRPTASRPVCPGVGLPSGARDQIFVFCLTIAGFLVWGALSGERMGL